MTIPRNCALRQIVLLVAAFVLIVARPAVRGRDCHVLSDPKLKGDALHPNVEGHARLAEKIFRELQSIGYAGL